MRRGLALILGATILGAAGCGGGGGPGLSELSIYPLDFAARVGDVIAFGAVATYSDGTQRTATSSVTWLSSRPAVATLTPGGVMTALTPGVAQVSATQGSVTSNVVTVTVSAVPDLPTAEWFPLGIGYWWEYTGSEVSTTRVRPAAERITLTQFIPRQVVRGGETWYDVQVKGSDPLEPPGHLYMRHDPQGLMRSDRVGWEPLNLLHYSLLEGMEWEDATDSRRTFLIDSVSDRVVVPAGTYEDCIKVIETDTAYDPVNRIIAWYARGVGIVQTQVYAGDELYSEQKLVRVQLGVPTR